MAVAKIIHKTVIAMAILMLLACFGKVWAQSVTAWKFFDCELSMPSDWTGEKLMGGLLLLAPKIEDNWQSNVFVEIRMDEKNRSLEQALAELAVNLKKNKEHFAEIKRETGKLPSGFAYGLLDYSCTQQGTSLREQEIVVELADGKRLFIVASATLSQWNKYQPIFSRLRESLKKTQSC